MTSYRLSFHDFVIRTEQEKVILDRVIFAFHKTWAFLSKRLQAFHLLMEIWVYGHVKSCILEGVLVEGAKMSLAPTRTNKEIDLP